MQKTCLDDAYPIIQGMGVPGYSLNVVASAREEFMVAFGGKQQK
jgi:hypothetical protein